MAASLKLNFDLSSFFWSVSFLICLSSSLAHDSTLSGSAVPTASPPVNKYVPHWAVHVSGGPEVADLVAKEHGFVNLGQIGTLKDRYHFRHNCTLTNDCFPLHSHNDEHTNRLLKHPKVHWAEQQKILSRRRRDITSFSDPYYAQQWFLDQPNGNDINVLPVWNKGITGKGVVVCIVDDGLDHSHPDMSENYDAKASYDLNDFDADPMPRDSDPINSHGTRCSGNVAASAGNGVCGVGVAYGSKVGGVRMLDGMVTDSIEAHSLNLQPQHIDIYSNSWGPNDDGETFEAPGPLARESFESGVKTGRDGKGSIFVFASGNGGNAGDDCNADGYANSIYTIAIGALTEHGVQPWYGEKCAASLGVTYSSGSYGDRSIATVDLHHGCTTAHSGTSAAAPIGAGILALALEANPALTWRDVQHVMVNAAKIVDPADHEWEKNGAGHMVSHKYGFGKMDAESIVSVASTWSLVGPQIIFSSPNKEVNLAYTFASRVEDAVSDSVKILKSDTNIRKLEHVQVYVRCEQLRRGDTELTLVSPSGTHSTLLSQRRYDYTSEAIDWTFMSVLHWDESPLGEWKLFIRSVGNNHGATTLKSWKLILYGTE